MTAPVQCPRCNGPSEGGPLCGLCAVELARKIIDSAANSFHACAVCKAAYSDTEPHAKNPRIPRNLCWVCAHLYQSANRPEAIPAMTI